jgi:hypothetical protein
MHGHEVPQKPKRSGHWHGYTYSRQRNRLVDGDAKSLMLKICGRVKELLSL